VFATDISEVSGFAIYAGQIAFILLVVLTIQVVLLRIKLIFVAKRKEKIKKIWRPYISKTIYGDRVKRLKIKRRDFLFILEEINYAFSLVKGEEVERLRGACLSMGLHKQLLKLLHSKNIKNNLFALITLGNLKDHMAWDQIKKVLVNKQTVLSLAAARSLVQIEPQRALTEILAITLTREDWPWANVAHVLKLAGPETVCSPLAELITTSPSYMQASLLRLFEVVQCEEIRPVTKSILEKTKDDKTASVCLHISQDPGILPLAKKYIKHDRWHVRMHAANAIGRFGGPDEIPELVLLLKDKEWWVRYRSAQALVSLPCTTKNVLTNIYKNMDDRYGKDILRQVITEREFYDE